MLPLPHRGISRSIGAHRSRPEIICDWIEGSVLFEEDALSQIDVVDVLLEQSIYDDQDYCFEQVSSVWRQLRLRLGWLGGGSPIRLHADRMVPTKGWKEVPGHSLCLLLSLAPFYTDWHVHVGSDYSEQGCLFEDIVKESMETLFKGWPGLALGWSKQRATRLSDVVPDLAQKLGENCGEITKWTSSKAHECGLDVVWRLPFPDLRGGTPVFLAQCASGKNWTEKIYEPDLEVWTRIIEFKAPPNKALAIPFALAESEFSRQCIRVRGLLLDRYRLLLAAKADPNWVSDELAKRVIEWLEPHVDWILGMNRI